MLHPRLLAPWGGVAVSERGRPPEAFYAFLRSRDAREAAPWQLRVLERLRFPFEPEVGLYKALKASLDLGELDGEGE